MVQSMSVGIICPMLCRASLLLLLLLPNGCTVVRQPPTVIMFHILPIDPPMEDYDDCRAFGRDALACESVLKI